MKFYVASSFRNLQTVRHVSEKLINRGFQLTYDWTRNEGVSTIEQLGEIGRQEIQAVTEADFVIVILPAGKGSHVELGIALGRGKKVYLYSPNEEVKDVEMTSTFYHVPEVRKCFGTIDELVETVVEAVSFNG
jgi:nucleoside 2-deoxyribosyltransferase